MPTDDKLIGMQKGDDNPYVASFRQNPGTRVRMQAAKSGGQLLTKKGLLDQQFVFPAPPLNQLARNLTMAFSDYDTISAGQFSRPQSMQLQTIQFDTIVVADDYPWQFYNPLRARGWEAEDVVRQLGSVLRAATPFNLIIEEVRYKGTPGGAYDFGPSPLLKMLATLRTLVATEQSGEPGTWYLTVGFTEHRVAGISQKKLGAASTKGGDGSRTLPASVALTSGTSLHDLAVKYYGSAAMWSFIKSANTWLGNLTATHDLGAADTPELKAASKAKRKLQLPVAAGGGRA